MMDILLVVVGDEERLCTFGEDREAREEVGGVLLLVSSLSSLIKEGIEETEDFEERDMMRRKLIGDRWVESMNDYDDYMIYI